VLARPAGVAGLITPWRAPFLAQARALAPALAAGCTVVLKPDEWAPLPAALLAEITTAAGLPAGVLNIVHGARHRKAPGTQARDALIAHPSVARLAFAGDAAAGEQVRVDAAAHRKVLSAELAGRSPCSENRILRGHASGAGGGLCRRLRRGAALAVSRPWRPGGCRRLLRGWRVRW
jgi:5-carboxymethyl-2-hydroxymuconic-semialdehyde dehydrogenase